MKKSIWYRTLKAMVDGLSKTITEDIIGATALVAGIAKPWLFHEKHPVWVSIDDGLVIIAFMFLYHLLRAIQTVWKEVRKECEDHEVQSALYSADNKRRTYLVQTKPPAYFRGKLILIGMFFVLCWGIGVYAIHSEIASRLLADDFQNQRDAASERIRLSVSLPPGTASPIASIFSVVNDSSNDIVDYKLWCSANKLQFVTREVILARNVHDRTWSHLAIDSQTALPKAGGSDSSSCIENIARGPEITCADITITFQYKLDIDANGGGFVSKERRFVTGNNHGVFGWIEKNINDPHFYCMEMAP
jgi:hypothetical protein